MSGTACPVRAAVFVELMTLMAQVGKTSRLQQQAQGLLDLLKPTDTAPSGASPPPVQGQPTATDTTQLGDLPAPDEMTDSAFRAAVDEVRMQPCERSTKDNCSLIRLIWTDLRGAVVPSQTNWPAADWCWLLCD